MADRKFQQGAASMDTRVALMEQSMDGVHDDIAAIKNDVREILKSLNQMSGGKKALMGLFSLIGMAIGVITGVVAMVVGRH